MILNFYLSIVLASLQSMRFKVNFVSITIQYTTTLYPFSFLNIFINVSV